MFTDFMGDFGMKDLVGGFLQYEQIKRGDDVSGQSQSDVYNTPPKTQQVNDVVTSNAPDGLSMPVMIGGGLLALVAIVLLVRK